jgi:predicted Rossmann fold nucleotide-binding protein DprA/Smf involved in DNA uptake
MHIDEIKALLGLPMEKISAALVMMKLKGLVKETDNLTYLAISETAQSYEA